MGVYYYRPLVLMDFGVSATLLLCDLECFEMILVALKPALEGDGISKSRRRGNEGLALQKQAFPGLNLLLLLILDQNVKKSKCRRTASQSI